MKYNFLLFIILLNNVGAFISVQNNRLVDNYGRERIFHGVNVVYKGFPWHPDINSFHPSYSFSLDDVSNLKNWGFNVIRLGVMWPGLEPIENNYNMTYVKILKQIVEMCEQYDIYVILDFHQDVLSEHFCGEGIPSWAIYTQNRTHKFPYPIDKNFEFTNNIPSKKDCQKHNWVSYQFTQEASRAYQDLYDNYNGLKNKFINFWKIIATNFKNCNNCIGYELMNEPWAGDIFNNPSLLLPHNADIHNLEKFYQDIALEINKIDNNHCILFESVTWDIYGVGFNSIPGNNSKKSILSYHAYFPPNIFIDTSFKVRKKDIQRLNCGGFLTEFSYGSGNIGDKSDLDKALKMLDTADKYIQSWTVWEYKQFFPITGPNKGFYRDNGELTNTYYTLSRPYAKIINGRIKLMKFDNSSKLFRLSYKPYYNSFSSEIYLNSRLHYPYGYILDFNPINSIFYSFNKRDNTLIIYNNNNSCFNVININIYPKLQI